MVFARGSLRGWGILLLLGFCLAGAFAGQEGTDAALTPQQLEADWLRQEELRESAQAWGGKPTPEQDARGGCDGVKTGRWGFHTESEPNPWWQVDLGAPVTLGKVLLYNRCDSCGERNTRILIWASDDGKAFRQVYQHDGTMFLGQPDGKPLVVALNGVATRYLRLGLNGTSYFHLDEVEVYPAREERNAALGKPATQSSISQWSETHAGPEGLRGPVVERVIRRGLLLAANLKGQGVDTGRDERELRALQEQLAGMPENASEDALRRVDFQARRVVRAMALSNPLLDFDSLLFVKAAPGRFPHMSDQFYGWWSRPGGGIYVLDGFKGPRPRLRCLTAGMPEGSFLRPELSYDGKRVLFAYCRYYPHVPDVRNKASKVELPEDAFYHLFEMNVDGTGRRQLTHRRYDDFDARYLPNGEILFLSTRKGQFLQCSRQNTLATAAADLPDSYVRCGGDNYRPVPVFTLHVMDPNGGNMRPLSAFENFEWTPAVGNDGRILYTRWDYIDRFNGHFFSLWATNPDGSNGQLVYGNYTARPQVISEARPIPGSSKLVFTASAHHSILGGALALFDRARGTEGLEPITRLTPEVPFPETETNVGSYYQSPYPLSEEHFLTAWSDRKLPPHSRVDDTKQNPVNATGLYLYDAFGNLNLVYRDPEIASTCPIPVRARPKPPAYPTSVAWDGPQEGRFLVQDVTQGMAGVPRGSVRWLRVVGTPPKPQPHMNNPVLGVSKEDVGKFLLGMVPVEADGSAYFRVPSGVSIHFQAVDDEGYAVQTMRSLTYVNPGQTLSCVGCHEGRDSASPVASRRPMAAMREPSRLMAGPEGTWPLRYDRLVQPVLDRHCVSCHRPGSPDAQAARFDLTPARSYDSILTYRGGELHKLSFERDRSDVGDCAARRSTLLSLLTTPDGHYGVRLDPESRERLVVWMDLYSMRQGHYSPTQEAQLVDLRRQLAPMLVERVGEQAWAR